jgi:hypothetical protein
MTNDQLTMTNGKWQMAMINDQDLECRRLYHARAIQLDSLVIIGRSRITHHFSLVRMV